MLLHHASKVGPEVTCDTRYLLQLLCLSFADNVLETLCATCDAMHACEVELSHLPICYDDLAMPMAVQGRC